jgi:hypothetical protein
MNLTTKGDLRQRNEARVMLINAYQSQLDQDSNVSEISHIKTQMTKVLQAAQLDPMPDNLTQWFGDRAFKLNLPSVGLAFYKKLPVELTSSIAENYGDIALANRQHELAAYYYFLARERATSHNESRRLFQLGIKTLMAASLFDQAMQEAHAKLADLAEDRPTLRFLASTALAAGDPAAAAAYARKLVFK